MKFFCLLFTIVCFTAAMILTVHLRTVNSRLFFECRKRIVDRQRLKHELTQKELEASYLINRVVITAPDLEGQAE
ncbi:hypothetical protein SMSP2_01697 [Limihaloglobus sulfuriphilus]|uniref:Cell division protein FtsL n=1 Tax=Limihaloglobus sulfuriphilus TaxID=1851148 RepID=A0A1Q2MF49_9BACT|nr:hypothetical protein [Limihaloglobus sulfuriphilus]AQQ71326.1 hypothetical protein SMSP2_01697 [Limihaloglobus sulfuriphilus]